jgi:hypothetical protein
MGDFQRIRKTVGHQDRDRIEQHLAGLRDVETRMQERLSLKNKAQIARCQRPEPPARDWIDTFGDGTGHEEKEAKSQLMSDILATALACDLTRVFSFEWSATQSHAVYWETGARMEHHPMNHAIGDSDEYAATVRFIMKNYAYLAKALATKAEAGGTLLDHTLVVGTSEHASARKHNWMDHPFLLLGRASGRIPGGRHIRHARPEDNFDAPNVLLSAVRAAGVPLEALGQHAPKSERQTKTAFDLKT